jgi:hypothetical protein
MVHGTRRHSGKYICSHTELDKIDDGPSRDINGHKERTRALILVVN